MRDKKIYVITHGEYSDYEILTVESSKSIAEKIVEHLKKVTGDDTYRVEEFKINEYDFVLGRYPVEISIDLNSERILSIERPKFYVLTKFWIGIDYNNKNKIRIHFWASNEEEAKEMAEKIFALYVKYGYENWRKREQAFLQEVEGVLHYKIIS